MENTINGKVMVGFDVKALKEAIDKINIAQGVVAKMVLGRDPSFISNSCTRGTMNKDDLKKLCEFLSLEYDKIIIKPEPKKEEPKSEHPATSIAHGQAVDTLIIGLNSLYEIEKQNNKLMQDILKELQINNTKTNRLENALGQIVSHTLVIRDTMNNSVVSYLRDTKSGVAVITGRMKDLLNKFK